MMRSVPLVVCSLLLYFILHAQAPPGGAYNIRDYGAAGDGHTLDTKAINKAVAACVKAGGGTVVVPSGKFVTGTFLLYSNINLYLSPGAVIMASENTDDYLLQTDYGFSGSGAGGKKLGLIFADRAENVSITGSGTIDGRAASFFYLDSVQVSGEEENKYTRQGKNYMASAKGNRDAPVMWKGQFVDRPGTQIIFRKCKKVILRDLTVLNANDWTIDLNACDDVKVLGITINNDMRVPNSDGIDMYDSKNVIVADCDVRAGDDGMAVISTSNLTVTNCSITSRSSGIRIGYNGFNDDNSGNLLFDNVRIYGSNRGIGIFQRRKGNIENILFSNMIIDTRLYPGQWWGHGEPIHISALPAMGFKEVGTISNVRFTNIIASGEQGIVLYGSTESTLKDIRFDNVRINLTRGPLTDLYGGNFDLRATNDPQQAIFKHDIPAIYARYVKGLSLKGVDVHWDPSLPDYFTNALACDHFDNLTIDGFSGSAAPHAGANAAVVALSDGSNAQIKGLRDGGGADWLSQQNVAGLQFEAPAGQRAKPPAEGSRPLFARVDAGSAAPKGFVSRVGTGFQVDGKPYYYIGTNYWQGGLLGTGTFGKEGRLRLERELTFLAAHGVKNLRVVAGAEGNGAINGSYRVGPSLQPEKGKFSEDALKSLDYLLSEMDKRHMKAVVYFSNNWDWSGGFLQYLNWNGRLADSQLVKKNNWEELRDQTSRFYICEPCKEDYFRLVQQIVGRTNHITGRAYAADPAIMAWEMGNEPRPMRPSSNAAYKAWIVATAALVKSMDAHHLVTIGTEGQASVDDDIEFYKEIHTDANIDYLTIHVWPKNWGYFSDTAIAAGMSTIISRSKDYIEKHAAVANQLGKPLVIEEFGLPRDRQSFDPASSARLRQQYYEFMFGMVRESILHKGPIAGCNFWAFGGEGRPVKGQAMWKQGDGYLGDPPMEEQGLNAVFNSDVTCWKLVQSYTGKAPF